MIVCKSCGAPIYWAQTPSGKSIPLDPDPVPNGNVALAEVCGREMAIVVSPADRAHADENGIPMRQTHFVSCPFESEHRRAR